MLNNRAAVRWQLGDREGARADLRQALGLAPALAPALLNLAVLQERAGSADATRTRTRAQQAQTETPRGFPYGVGNGDMRQPANFRWMLQIEPGALQLWRPPGARTVP